jgi:putative Mg2+ transporter-C (MgtC) family protein
MDWLTADWKTLLPSAPAHIALALVATLCGAIIGMERQRHEKPAGLRTLILVCLGSAGFTMAGYTFTGSTGDSGRVAAQIVTGIGFLGAGIILHSRGMIIGVTTAAGVWVTAAVGMVAGAGYAGAAFGLGLLVRFILASVGIYERWLCGKQPPVAVSLDFDPSGGRTRVRIERVLIDYSAAGIQAEWKGMDAGMDRLTLRLQLPRHHLRELLDDLVSIPEIRKVNQTSPASTSSP